MKPTKVQGLPKIKQREEGSCQKNLPIPHASYLVMLPHRSTKKEDRHSTGEKTPKNNQVNCRKMKTTLYVLLAKCQAFSQIRFLQQERKYVKVLSVKFYMAARERMCLAHGNLTQSTESRWKAKSLLKFSVDRHTRHI